MAILVRKINRAKWEQSDICNGQEITADAITNCLRTRNNTLSVWEINSEAEIDEALLAIAAGMDHLVKIDVVLLCPDFLKEQGIKTNSIPGDTPVSSLIDTHLDISELSYEKLGIVAYHIVEKFKENKIIRRTQRRLGEILKAAVDSKRVAIDDLSEYIRPKIDI